MQDDDAVQCHIEKGCTSKGESFRVILTISEIATREEAEMVSSWLCAVVDRHNEGSPIAEGV